MTTSLLRAAVALRDREQGLTAANPEGFPEADEARSALLAKLLVGRNCAVCGKRLNGDNSVGVCSRSKECRTESTARWKVIRQASRAQRPSPRFKTISCKWPESICLELIVPWSPSKLCRQHARVMEGRSRRKVRP